MNQSRRAPSYDLSSLNRTIKLAGEEKLCDYNNNNLINNSQRNNNWVMRIYILLILLLPLFMIIIIWIIFNLEKEYNKYNRNNLYIHNKPIINNSTFNDLSSVNRENNEYNKNHLNNLIDYSKLIINSSTNQNYNFNKNKNQLI